MLNLRSQQFNKRWKPSFVMQWWKTTPHVTEGYFPAIMLFSTRHVVCSCTDRCPAPRRCCTSCQRCTSGGSGWMRCSTSCLGFCAARWAPGSGADQHSRQSCTVCLKTWLGETHKAVVTLILLIYLQSYDHMNMMETMWYSLIYWFWCLFPLYCSTTLSGVLWALWGQFCGQTTKNIFFIFIIYCDHGPIHIFAGQQNYTKTPEPV